MEAVQQFSPSKNHAARNFKKSIDRTFSSIPCENISPINYHQNGILQTPPPPFLYHSIPQILVHQKQPPLLPLPIPNVVQNYNHINTPPLYRGFSCPPMNKKVNKNKKSKSTKSSPKKEESPKPSKVVMNISSTNPLGPDPKDLPKDVSMVLSLSSTGKTEQVDAQNSHYMQSPKKDPTTLSLLYADIFKGNDNSVNKFSSSEVFAISPPPSSLPLPTFSLRPKLSCNVEAAAGVDAGATDDLRRLLRLR